ncbi:MAG: hypothetical protein V4792_02750 [Pseudomonadota bacterium]
MDRRLAVLTVAATVLGPGGLAGCALVGGPRTLTLSQADLQRSIERQFPLQRRLFEVFEIQVARPLVRLLPELNRVATELDLVATERLGGRSVRGSLALDYALRYEASDASIRLAHVQVQDVRLELGGGPLSPSRARIGALLAERLLDDFVLYRADAERLRLLQRAGVTGAEIAVTGRGIEVRFAEPG